MDVVTDSEIIKANVSETWQIQGDAIVKVVPRKDFADGLAYINRVAELAEELNHHPDVDLRWESVTLHLSTHYLGGITELDFQLARRIDALDEP
jgi:4a-hydroxytetrahydrobiopterin dehydratase